MSKKSRARRAQAKLDLELSQRIAKHTLNWKDESSSPLVPNLVPQGEMESLRREFINSIAKGESSSELDKRALRNPNQFFEDTIEGIHRWHTYGKER